MKWNHAGRAIVSQLGFTDRPDEELASVGREK